MDLLSCCLQILVECETDILGSLKELLRGNTKVRRVTLFSYKRYLDIVPTPPLLEQRDGSTTLHIYYEV